MEPKYVEHARYLLRHGGAPLYFMFYECELQSTPQCVVPEQYLISKSELARSSALVRADGLLQEMLDADDVEGVLRHLRNAYLAVFVLNDAALSHALYAQCKALWHHAMAVSSLPCVLQLLDELPLCIVWPFLPLFVPQFAPEFAPEFAPQFAPRVMM